MLELRQMQVAAFTLVGLIYECMSLNIGTDSQYQHVTMSIDKDTFLLEADEPLSGCQVRSLSGVNKIYDLSEGKHSPDYWGTGLESGQCGVSLVATRTSSNVYTPFGWRVRGQNGGWQYGTTVIFNPETSRNAASVLPLVSGPRLILAEPGSNVSFVFDSEIPLSTCYFQWPGRSKLQTSGSDGTFAIDNSKLAKGSCKLTLFNVQPEKSGIITGAVISKITNMDQLHHIQLKTLIVKTAPSAPELSLSNSDGVYNEGDVMEASCQVGPARPVARITWLLNDEVIQGDFEDFSTTPWEFEAGDVTRNLTLKLSFEDDGKELVCRVHHIALPMGSTETKMTITMTRVTVAPSAPALSLSNANGVYNEGDVMEASCHVGPARPVARITWLLDYDVIQNESNDLFVYPSEQKAANVTQSLSRHLSIDDDGKELVCRVRHIALGGENMEAKKKITVLRVKVAPDAPALSLSTANGVYNEGDVMEASCHVGPARPVARITWLLNDDVIQNETNEQFLYPSEYKAATFTQSLSRQLSIDDDGKELVCRVYHVALLAGWIETRTNITVRKMTAAASFGSPNVTWLLAGVGGSLLVVAFVVAALLVHAHAAERWCFIRPGTGNMRPMMREQNVYDCALELRSDQHRR